MALLLRSLALPRKRLPLAGILILALATYTLLTFNISDYSHLRPPSCDRLPIPPSKTNPAPSRLHPIPALMAEGNVKWAALLAAQSRNVSAAAGEYRRRYKLDPPDGFDLWFAYAQRTGVKLVDEYDIIMEALAPLRKLGKVEVRRRTDALLDYGFDNAIGGLLVDASNEVVTFVKKGKERKIRKRQGHVILEGEEEGGFRTKGLLLMLEPVKGVLAERAKRWPAFRVPVNELAEARVLDTQVPPKTSKVWIEELWHEHAFERRTMANDIAAACGEESMFAKRVVGTRFEIGIEEVVGGVGGGLEGEGKEPGFVVEPKVDNDICERPELMSVGFPGCGNVKVSDFGL